MALPAPPVLQRLRALGLTQTALAAHLGVTQAAVSLWFTGKRPFDEPWRADAAALLAVVREHLAQGKPLATVAFRPSHFMNRGGTTRSGEGAPLTKKDLQALTTLQQSLAGMEPDRFMAAMHAWNARHTAAHLAKRATHDPPAWDLSAEELDARRRMAHALVLEYEHLLHLKARKALEDERHAHETP